jgi:hypothetical protein
MTLRRRLGRAINHGTGATQSTGPAEAPAKAARKTPRKNWRSQPSNVAGHGPLIGEPGLHVAIACIVKDEAEYLEEWLCFHFALGVDHVFLYDNGSTDGSFDLLEPYANHGLVTIVKWPLPGGQLGAYNHALRFFGPSVDWLAFVDVDEFIVPVQDDDIPSIFDRYPEAADLRMPRAEFSFSGHRTRPQGLVIEAYTDIGNTDGRDPKKGPRVKTILQPGGITSVDIHTSTVAEDAPQPAADGTVPDVAPRETVMAAELMDEVQVNHYYTRSWEEFEAKRFRGSAAGRLPRPGLPFDLPTIRVDTKAQRFIPETKAMMKRMRSLAPKPYLYGSELGLSHFPIPNDLGRFSEFAIVNMAAGFEEAQRGPAFRLSNYYTGVGYVGDLGAKDYQASPLCLSSSDHVRALAGHVRGEVAVALEATDVELEDGSATLSLDIEASGQRRCYALGFVLTTDGPLDIEAATERTDGSGSTAMHVELAKATTYVGVIQLDGSPQLVERATVAMAGRGSGVRVLDLFLLSYG